MAFKINYTFVNHEFGVTTQNSATIDAHNMETAVEIFKDGMRKVYAHYASRRKPELYIDNVIPVIS